MDNPFATDVFGYIFIDKDVALQERTTVQDFHACCFIGKSYNLLVELIPYFICNIYQGREMLKRLPV
jgi:hypothetical protein